MIISALALTALGLLVVATMDIVALLRWLLAIGWLAGSLAELCVIAESYKQYRRIRIDCDGALQVLSRTGLWQPAELGNGSLVLGRIAWLRFRLRNGRRCAELLTGDPHEHQSWRRFQVIWRHLGGRP